MRNIKANISWGGQEMTPKERAIQAKLGREIREWKRTNNTKKEGKR